MTSAQLIDFIRNLRSSKKAPTNKTVSSSIQDFSKCKCSLCGKPLDEKAVKKYEKLAKKRAASAGASRNNNCHCHGHQRHRAHSQQLDERQEELSTSTGTSHDSKDDTGYASSVSYNQTRQASIVSIQQQQQQQLDPENNSNPLVVNVRPIYNDRKVKGCDRSTMKSSRYRQVDSIDIASREYPIHVPPVPLEFTDRSAPIPSATAVHAPPNREIVSPYRICVSN